MKCKLTLVKIIITEWLRLYCDQQWYRNKCVGFCFSREKSVVPKQLLSNILVFVSLYSPKTYWGSESLRAFIYTAYACQDLLYQKWNRDTILKCHFVKDRVRHILGELSAMAASRAGFIVVAWFSPLSVNGDDASGATWQTWQTSGSEPCFDL